MTALVTRAASTALVEIHDAARTYGRGSAAVVALHDLTCSVHPGQLIAVAGPSGSGKSTLVHLMAGLDRPTRGTVAWPAIGDIAELRPGPVGVVFQSPSLIPALDVVENVALPLLLAGASPATARAEAEESLAHLDLAQLGARLPEELSGGQAQRVAVARVLAGGPRLILADEPTGQLDHAAGAAVTEALLRTARRLGAALVVTTHDKAVSGHFADVWSIHSGSLLADEASCSA